MEINKPEQFKPLPGKILVEIFDRNKTIGKLELLVPNTDTAIGSSDMTATGDGQHMERNGTVVAVCDRVKPTEKFNYYTDIEIEPGDEVYFSSSAYAKAFRERGYYTCGDRNFVIIDYHRLYMTANKMINGYMLLEAVEKSESDTIISPETKYYKDIYRLVKRGKPIEYVDKYHDDSSINEGDFVMTRFDKYPKLEESGHEHYSDNTYYIVQPKEIVGTVKF